MVPPRFNAIKLKIDQKEVKTILYIKVASLDLPYYLSTSGVMVRASDFGFEDSGSNPARGNVLFCFFLMG